MWPRHPCLKPCWAPTAHTCHLYTANVLSTLSTVSFGNSLILLWYTCVVRAIGGKVHKQHLLSYSKDIQKNLQKVFFFLCLFQNQHEQMGLCLSMAPHFVTPMPFVSVVSICFICQHVHIWVRVCVCLWMYMQWVRVSVCVYYGYECVCVPADGLVLAHVTCGWFHFLPSLLLRSAVPPWLPRMVSTNRRWRARATEGPGPTQWHLRARSTPLRFVSLPSTPREGKK